MREKTEAFHEIFEGVNWENEEYCVYPLNEYKKQLLIQLENIKQLETKYGTNDFATDY